MGLENLGCGGAEFLMNPLDQCFELGRRNVHPSVEVSDFRRDLTGTFQPLGLARSQDRLHAVNHTDHYPRTNSDSLVHDPLIVEVADRPTTPDAKNMPGKEGLLAGESYLSAEAVVDQPIFIAGR
jgi:hypothetical protein